MFTPPQPGGSNIESTADIMSRLSEDSGDSSPPHDPIADAPLFVRSETIATTEVKHEGKQHFFFFLLLNSVIHSF